MVHSGDGEGFEQEDMDILEIGELENTGGMGSSLETDVLGSGGVIGAGLIIVPFGRHGVDVGRSSRPVPAVTGNPRPEARAMYDMKDKKCIPN